MTVDVDIFQSSYDYNTDNRYISLYNNESDQVKALPDPPEGCPHQGEARRLS